MHRHLSAILAADAVGYSRLIEVDEAGTLTRFKTHLNEVFHPRIREHNGRIFKTTGDGVFAEFESVVDALLCAVEVQCQMDARNEAEVDEAKIRFRIGISIGDVIADEGDIFGEGVNVAARLEGLAEPGGICVHRDVYSQVQNRVPFVFEDMGTVSVKNIKRPIHVFKVNFSDTERPATTRDPSVKHAQPIHGKASIRTVALVLGAVGVGLVIPLGAYQANVSPPWPPGGMALTSLLGLISLFLTYEARARRQGLLRLAIRTVIFLAAAIVYGTLTGLLVYEAPGGERFVKGLICTAEASLVYQDQCPILTGTQLAEGQYNPETFWTPLSVTASRVLLLMSWLSTILCLGHLLGALLEFQTRGGAEWEKGDLGRPQRRLG